MDYIRIKHKVSELNKQVADWQRRIEIAQLQASGRRVDKQAGHTLV